MRTYVIWLTQKVRPLAQQVAVLLVVDDSKEKQEAETTTSFTQCYITKESYFPTLLKIQGVGKGYFPSADRLVYLYLSVQISYQKGISHSLSPHLPCRLVQPVYVITVLLLIEVNSRIPVSNRSKNIDGRGKTQNSVLSYITMNSTYIRRKLELAGLQIFN